MGTNFYKIDIKKDNKEGEHIGKRSAAGYYCWDCGITLNIYGEAWVHSSYKEFNKYGFLHKDRSKENPELYNPFDEDRFMDKSEWFKKCPSCGQEKEELKSIADGASGIELGFSDPNKEQQKGVKTVSSFSWATIPYEFINWVSDRVLEKCIVDEYGRELTGDQFLGMLNYNCPIRFYNSIGVEFC
jgi:hypothetical protein